jgi:hypothetical protein
VSVNITPVSKSENGVEYNRSGMLSYYESFEIEATSFQELAPKIDGVIAATKAAKDIMS